MAFTTECHVIQYMFMFIGVGPSQSRHRYPMVTLGYLCYGIPYGIRSKSFPVQFIPVNTTSRIRSDQIFFGATSVHICPCFVLGVHLFSHVFNAYNYSLNFNWRYPDVNAATRPNEVPHFHNYKSPSAFEEKQFQRCLLVNLYRAI